MIISYRRRYIFQHCRKTAGSAVTVALSRHLGPDDVQIGAWGDASDAGIKPNRRFWIDLMSPKALSYLLFQALRRQQLPTFRELNSAHKLPYVNRIGPMPEHAAATDVARYDPVAWRNYFKFCFVRNPFDQMLSAWRFRMSELDEVFPFCEFLERAAEGQPHRYLPVRITNWPIYTIDDKIAVDFVGRFESLDRDLRTAFEEIGLPPPQKLPSVKRSGSLRSYREAYTARERKLVEKICEKEIETFRYAF